MAARAAREDGVRKAAAPGFPDSPHMCLSCLRLRGVYAAAAGQGERALKVFQELRDTPGLAPDLRSYNLAIKGCESPPTRVLRPQQLQQALVLAGELVAQGLEPDAITYGTIIDLCARVSGGAVVSCAADRSWRPFLSG